MNKHDIKHVLQHHTPELHQLGFASIGLFGSFVRGEQTEESDIDILYDFHSNRTSLDAVLSLQELLETHFKRPIHVVSANYVHPLLKDDILQEMEWLWKGRS